LPYGIKVSNYDCTGIVEVTLFNVHDALIAINNGHFRLNLRPLSDIIKEIEYNGKKFVPMMYWDDENRRELLSFTSESYKYVEYLEYFIVEKLLEWHFDIFDLIQNNLAIDINTIKQ